LLCSEHTSIVGLVYADYQQQALDHQYQADS
jgi:hypothetical protein